MFIFLSIGNYYLIKYKVVFLKLFVLKSIFKERLDMKGDLDNLTIQHI